MKLKLESLTKLNSLILVVSFTIVLLPTCKKNEVKTTAKRNKAHNTYQPALPKANAHLN